MSTEDQQPKVLYAPMLSSAILAGCASLAGPSDSQQRVTAYLEKAQSEVDECVSTARRLSSQSPLALRTDRADGRHLCAAPKAEVETLFDDAERAVRLERGTHMYLTLYHQRSTALMREMQGEEGGTDEQLLRQEHALELENAALK